MASGLNGTSKLPKHLTINQVLIVFELHHGEDESRFMRCAMDAGFSTILPSVSKNGVEVSLALPVTCLVAKNIAIKDARVQLRAIARDNGIRLLRCIAFELETWSAWLAKTDADPQEKGISDEVVPVTIAQVSIGR